MQEKMLATGRSLVFFILTLSFLKERVARNEPGEVSYTSAAFRVISVPARALETGQLVLAAWASS